MSANCTGGLCSLVAHSPQLINQQNHNAGVALNHDINNNNYYADQNPSLAHDQGMFPELRFDPLAEEGTADHDPCFQVS